MFRVKLRVDARILKEYSRKVKTGVRGVGIVRTKTETVAGGPPSQAAIVRKAARETEPSAASGIQGLL